MLLARDRDIVCPCGKKKQFNSSGKNIFDSLLIDVCVNIWCSPSKIDISNETDDPGNFSKAEKQQSKSISCSKQAFSADSQTEPPSK